MPGMAQLGGFAENGAGCPGTDIGAADDTVSGPFNLGFTFPYPGGMGSTTSIDIAPNGYIYFEAGTNTSSRCCAGAFVGAPTANFLSATPSLAVFGHDLNASATSVTGAGAIYFETGPGVAVISWQEVNAFGAAPITPNTFQVQLFANGTIVVDYRSTGFTEDALVGYSEGNGVADNGGVDLSAGASGMAGLSLIHI